MKVLFVTSSTTPYGGGSKSFLQMVKGVLSYGVNPLIVFPDNNGLFKIMQQEGIPCVALRYSYRMSIYPPTTSLRDKIRFIPRLLYSLIINNLATIQLLNITKKFKPDIIHTNVSVTTIGYYIARLLKIPHIWHIREYADLDFNMHYYPFKKIQQRRYKQPHSYTICITKDIQKHHMLGGWDNSKVIYNGIYSENELFYQPNKKSYFLFAGRIEHAKGVIPLIDAYAEYCKKNDSPIPLHIAGNGSAQYKKLIQEKIEEHNINKYVFLLGMRDDILSLYKEARAIIVPSISEAFGRITAEAMFAGCLVIGNDTAGTKEQFDIGKAITGDEIALRYTTHEQLINHLLDVTNNPIKLYEPIILRGRETAKQLYSTEQHAKSVYEFYNKILSI